MTSIFDRNTIYVMILNMFCWISPNFKAKGKIPENKSYKRYTIKTLQEHTQFEEHSLSMNDSCDANNAVFVKSSDTGKYIFVNRFHQSMDHYYFLFNMLQKSNKKCVFV